MVEPIDAIFEEREELMVSPTGGNPTLRIAHFLKPSVTSTEGLPPPFLSAEPTISELENLPLKVCFRGCNVQMRGGKCGLQACIPSTNPYGRKVEYMKQLCAPNIQYVNTKI